MNSDQHLYSIVNTDPPRYLPYIVGCAVGSIVIALVGVGTLLVFLHADINRIADSLNNLDTNLCTALSVISPEIDC